MTSKSFPQKEKKKKRNFSHWNLSAGWTNIKPVEDSSSRENASPSTSASLCENMHLLVGWFQRDVKNNTVKYWDTQEAESKTKRPNQKRTHAENDTKLRVEASTEAAADNSCTLYKTRSDSHPDRCENRKKTKADVSVSSFTMYMWGRRHRQDDSLFTRSAMMI